MSNQTQMVVEPTCPKRIPTMEADGQWIGSRMSNEHVTGIPDILMRTQLGFRFFIFPFNQFFDGHQHGPSDNPSVSTIMLYPVTRAADRRCHCLDTSAAGWKLLGTPFWGACPPMYIKSVERADIQHSNYSFDSWWSLSHNYAWFSHVYPILTHVIPVISYYVPIWVGLP